MRVDIIDPDNTVCKFSSVYKFIQIYKLNPIYESKYYRNYLVAYGGKVTLPQQCLWISNIR